MLTEFCTTNIRPIFKNNNKYHEGSFTVTGSAEGAQPTVYPYYSYYGIRDLISSFGLEIECYIYGINTLNGKLNILKNNGEESMINTDINYTLNTNMYLKNFNISKTENYNLGDIFTAKDNIIKYFANNLATYRYENKSSMTYSPTSDNMLSYNSRNNSKGFYVTCSTGICGMVARICQHAVNN